MAVGKCPACGNNAQIVKCDTCGSIGCDSAQAGSGCAVTGKGAYSGQRCRTCKKGTYKRI